MRISKKTIYNGDMMSNIKKSKNTSLGTENTLRLLMLFTTYEELTVQKISEVLELNISAVYRIVNTMSNMNFIEQQDNRAYKLRDSYILRLYNKVNTEIRDYSKPIVTELVESFNESIYIGEIYDGNKMMIIHKEEGTRHLQWRDNIGSVYPVAAGVAGKIILAHDIRKMSVEEAEKFLFGLELVEYTEHSITDYETLRLTLEQYYRDGYGITIEQHIPGSVGISVPIFNFDRSECRASLTMMMATSNYDASKNELYIQALKNAAEKIGENII